MNVSKDTSLLNFHLESIAAGGSDLVTDDVYEIVGDNNAVWDVSISTICETSLEVISNLEDRHDKLREALENVMYYIDTDDMRNLDLNKARAILKETEDN